MEYKTVERLERRANAQRDGPTIHRAISREERLERWVQLLERKPRRRLNTLWETEYQRPVQRNAMRGNNTALTVAFEDPEFRAAGLSDDTFETAKRFFSLSNWELHEIVCSCRFGRSLEARYAASMVRWTIRQRSRTGLFTRLMRYLGFRTVIGG